MVTAFGRRARPVIAILAFGLTAVALQSCKDENPLTGESPSSVIFPTNDVRYNRDVQTLFNQACTLAGCHDDNPSNTSSLRLTSHWNTVFAVPGVVVAGSPGQSTLVLRIEGALGPRMPPRGNPLNKNQTDGIRTWIAEGALNN
jgi:hypothetical protein